MAIARYPAATHTMFNPRLVGDCAGVRKRGLSHPKTCSPNMEASQSTMRKITAAEIPNPNARPARPSGLGPPAARTLVGGMARCAGERGGTSGWLEIHAFTAMPRPLSSAAGRGA